MGEVEARVTELLAENGREHGFWRSCSGCFETSDGCETGLYPFNRAFGCHLGSGCTECGGIGAIWDTTDYADMADWISNPKRQFSDWLNEGPGLANAAGCYVEITVREKGAENG